MLITGAAAGVGRATTISFARAGAAYIIAADLAPFRDLEMAIEEAVQSNAKARPKSLLLNLDITDRVKVQDAAKHVKNFCGSLDVMINNAGVSRNMSRCLNQIQTVIGRPGR